jgi:excisionase family DNA binding protein
MLTTGQAARQLGVGDHVLARLARQGHIRLERVGRCFVVPESDLAEIQRALEGRDVQRYNREGDDVDH